MNEAFFVFLYLPYCRCFLWSFWNFCTFLSFRHFVFSSSIVSSLFHPLCLEFLVLNNCPTLAAFPRNIYNIISFIICILFEEKENYYIKVKGVEFQFILNKFSMKENKNGFYNYNLSRKSKTCSNSSKHFK